MCTPMFETAAAAEPLYHRQLRDALQVPSQGVVQYRDYTLADDDDDGSSVVQPRPRSCSPASVVEETPGVADGSQLRDGCSTPRGNQQDGTTPFSSPQKALWTPVRDGGGSVGAARHTPRPRSQHNTPAATARKDRMQARRILDADGISTDPESSVLCWGSRSALIVGIRDAAYRWSGLVECLLEAHCPITCVAASTEDESDDLDGFAAVGLENGLVHVFRFDKSGCQKEFGGPPIGETLSKVTSLSIHDNVLFIGDASGVFSLYSLTYYHVLFRTSLTSPIFRIAPTADGDHVAVGLQDTILVFHRSSMHAPTPIRVGAATKLELEGSQSLSTCFGGAGPVKALTWFDRPDMLSTLIYASGTGEVCVHSLGNGVIGTISLGCQVLAIASSRTSDEFAVSLGNPLCVDNYGDAGSIFVVHFRRGKGQTSGQLRKMVRLDGHSSAVLHMALSPQGDTLATAAGVGDDTLRMWAAFPPMAPARHISNAFDDELR